MVVLPVHVHTTKQSLKIKIKNRLFINADIKCGSDVKAYFMFYFPQNVKLTKTFVLILLRKSQDVI